MRTLRRGDRGEAVKTLQDSLNRSAGFELVTVDGHFGPATEDAVEAFQNDRGLYPDGIVGRRTWSELGVGEAIPKRTTEFDWKKVPADRYKDGYASFRLREDVAARYMAARAEVLAAGAILTSSGSRRRLTANVHRNRSATSLHYIGRALDLYVYSAMVDPHADPYVVQRHPTRDRAWVVWARASEGESKTLLGYTYAHTEVETAGRFVNLTELMGRHGFQFIRARKSFFRSKPNANNGAAEWWHTQDETGLVQGETTFGSELLRIYTISEVRGTPPWDYRERLFKAGWF